MSDQELIGRIINRSFTEEPRHMIDDVDAAWIIALVRQQIGRELLDCEDISEDVEDIWWVKRINKICKLQKLNLLETTDATVWAKEFVRLHGGDEELMVTWFANAMCAQMDADRQHDKARYVEAIEKSRNEIKGWGKMGELADGVNEGHLKAIAAIEGVNDE